MTFIPAGMPPRAWAALTEDQREAIRAERRAQRAAKRESNPVTLELMAEARTLCEANSDLRYVQALNTVAAKYGFKDWQAFRRRIPRSGTGVR